MTWEVVPGGSAVAAAKTAANQAPAKEPMTHGKQLRVLVVDDEPTICKALTMSLSRSGYETLAAQTGDAALSIVRTEHIDVMLVDLRIHDVRGDVIFEIAISHQPHLRYQTLFMTGDITERAQKLIAACKCHYLRKPFDLRDMHDAVAALAPRARDAAG